MVYLAGSIKTPPEICSSAQAEEKEIILRMEQLDFATQKLGEVLLDLGMRLTPVSRPQDETENSIPSAPSITQLGSAIDNITYTLQTYHQRICNMRDRLEI